MSSGRRITLALVGLVLLAVVGWLVTDPGGHGTSGEHGNRPPVTSVSSSAPRPAGASG